MGCVERTTLRRVGTVGRSVFASRPEWYDESGRWKGHCTKDEQDVILSTQHDVPHVESRRYVITESK